MKKITLGIILISNLLTAGDFGKCTADNFCNYYNTETRAGEICKTDEDCGQLNTADGCNGTINTNEDDNTSIETGCAEVLAVKESLEELDKQTFIACDGFEYEIKIDYTVKRTWIPTH